ncbi:conserved hypothetical protein [Ricinus communis]|uniref:Uncharacterized protein n=1 Tax=Ricinus communis TaxID=3988 RepID=B9T8U8_RICCO|nr:conserved hypothetical protein [Ricinus communis]
MADFLPFLNVLKDSALSHVAMAGYLAIAAAWALRIWLVAHPKHQARRIISLYKDDASKIAALRELLGTAPPLGLKRDELIRWAEIQMRGRTRALLLIAYVITLITGIPTLRVTMAVNNPGTTTKVLTQIGVTSRIIAGRFDCLSGAGPLSILANYPIYFHVTQPETIISADPPLDVPPGTTARFTISLNPNATGSCGGWRAMVAAVAIFSDGTKLKTPEQSIDASDVSRASKVVLGKDDMLAALQHRDDKTRYHALEGMSSLNLDNLTIHTILKSKIADQSPKVAELAYSKIAQYRFTDLTPELENQWNLLNSKLTLQDEALSVQLLELSRALLSLDDFNFSDRIVKLIVNKNFQYSILLLDPLSDKKNRTVLVKTMDLLEEYRDWAKWTRVESSSQDKTREELGSRYSYLLSLAATQGDEQSIPRIKKLLVEDKNVMREFLVQIAVKRTAPEKISKDPFVSAFVPDAKSAWAGSEVIGRQFGMQILVRTSSSNQEAQALLRAALADKDADVRTEAALEIRNGNGVAKVSLDPFIGAPIHASSGHDYELALKRKQGLSWHATRAHAFTSSKLKRRRCSEANCIPVGEKYALIALPRIPLDAANLPDDIELAPGLWFAQKLPFGLERHWREWIGTVRADQIAKAQLVLLAKCPSTTTNILDGENQVLMESIGRFYQGLQLAVPIWVDGEVVRLTGANRGGAVDVRQVSTVTSPAPIHYGHADLVGIEALRRASDLVPILNGFPKGEYLRLCRVLNAYFSGIAENDLRERLHQFCRCIEGLILADPGQTTKQFKSRTELFVGPRLHAFMGNLYLNRSAVEHMNDPVLTVVTENERRAFFLEMTLISEHIARYCLLNILLKPNLRQQYKDETILSTFWSLREADRRNLWGPPLDVDALRKDLRKRRTSA